MRTRTFGSALAVIALATALQLTAAAASADKAAEVLAATRKALGGKKLEGLKSFTAQAALQRNIGNFQIGSDVELFLELPDKYFRAEAMSRGPVPMSVTTGIGFNGDKSLARMNAPGMPGAGGGMVIRMGGPGGPMPGGEKPTPEQEAQIQAMALRSARQEISRLMLGWFGTAHPSINPEYSYAGEAESPDGKAHVIDVKGSDGFEARLFVDQESHLPLMVTYKGPQMRMQTQNRQAGGQMTEEDRQRMREELEKLRTQPPQMAEYSIFFGDWREVDGIRFPHQVQRAVAGTTDEEWTVSRIKVNPKIDPKKFDSQ